MRGYEPADHPVIRDLMETGWPDGREPETPHCPVCGEACERVYLDGFYRIVGCDECLTDRDAWAVLG